MFDKAVILGEKKEELVEFPIKKYTCSKCGVVFGAGKDQKVDACILCGETQLECTEDGEVRPLYYLPFTETEDDVLKDYKKKVFWNPLVPFAFKRKKTLQTIHKIFLPAFLVNATHKGDVVFLAGDKEKITKKRKKVLEIKKYEDYYKVYVDYHNVLLNTSTKIEDKLFTNICNYDYASMKEFTVSDIGDARYIFGDVSATEMGEKERERISKYSLLKVRNNINHALKKLKSDETSIEFYDAKEVLLPVYYINVKYGKKEYPYFINGQTGHSYLYLPVGILKAVLWALLFGGIVFLITYLLIYYL